MLIDAKARLCDLSLPEVPPGRPLVSSRQTTSANRLSVDLTTDTITLPAPDGSSVAVRAGSASVLRWFPMLIAGCFLSDVTGWECRTEFARENLPFGDPRGATVGLAKALGLRPVAPAERVASASRPLLARLASLPDQIRGNAQAALNRILSGTENADAIEVSLDAILVLQDRDALLTSYLPVMVGAIENPKFNPRNTHSAKDRLHWLIDNLPAPQLVPYIRQRLTAALDRSDPSAADLDLAQLWLGVLRNLPPAGADAGVFSRVISDHRVRNVAALIKAVYHDRAPVSSRRILVDWILDDRTSPEDRRYFAHLLATMPDGTFANMTPDEHRIIDDPGLRYDTAWFVQRLADTGPEGLHAMMDILHRGIADSDQAHRIAMQTVVRRGLARMGTRAAGALPEIAVLFNQSPSPLTSLDGVMNHPGQEHMWRLTMARMGLPLEYLPYSNGDQPYERDRDRTEVRSEVAVFDPNKD